MEYDYDSDSDSDSNYDAFLYIQNAFSYIAVATRLGPDEVRLDFDDPNIELIDPVQMMKYTNLKQKVMYQDYTLQVFLYPLLITLSPLIKH